VTGERVRGAIVYGAAAALLLAAGVWWVLAAPREIVDPQIRQWEQAAERVLPDDEAHDHSGMVALAPSAVRDVQAALPSGKYEVRVVCVGDPDSEVRVSLGQEGTDSGIGLGCDHDGGPPGSFEVAVADWLRMAVNVGEVGPVVFRYTVEPAGT
jgi:hypothetical protein